MLVFEVSDKISRVFENLRKDANALFLYHKELYKDVLIYTFNLVNLKAFTVLFPYMCAIIECTSSK